MEEILKKYLQYAVYKNRTPDTIRSYRTKITPYLKYPLEDWVSVYFDKIKQRKAITSQRELTDLNVFFKWAVNEELLKENPFAMVPRPEIGLILPRPLTRKQVKDIIYAAGKLDLRAKVIYATFLYTGLRRNELLKLEEQNIDFEGAIRVVQGKHKKDRLVPLNSYLLELLKYWKYQRPKHQYFFCTSWSVLTRIKRKVEESSCKHSIHQLRHTFASLSLESGMDLRTLQKILGHNKLETTAKYLETSVDHMRSQVDKLSFF